MDLSHGTTYRIIGDLDHLLTDELPENLNGMSNLYHAGKRNDCYADDGTKGKMFRRPV